MVPLGFSGKDSFGALRGGILSVLRGGLLCVLWGGLLWVLWARLLCVLSSGLLYFFWGELLWVFSVRLLKFLWGQTLFKLRRNQGEWFIPAQDCKLWLVIIIPHFPEPLHCQTPRVKLRFQSGYLVCMVLALAALTQVCFIQAKWPEALDPRVNLVSPGTSMASTVASTFLGLVV